MFHYRGTDFKERLARMLKDQAFREAFNAFSINIETLGSKQRFADNLSFERCLDLYEAVFKDRAHVLSTFASFRDQFEREFLCGDYNSAQETLERAKDEIGESFWYLRSKILVFVYQDRLDELTTFCETSKKRRNGALISYLINRAYLLTQSNETAMHLQGLLASDINELRQGSSAPFAGFLTFLFAPDPLIQHIDYTECLPVFSMLTVVDQYHALVDLLPRLFVASPTFSYSEEQLSLANAFLSEVRRHVSDPLIHRDFFGASLAPSKLTEYESLLCDRYDEGRYQDVIDLYLAELSSFSNAIAFINLVAKSIAYGACVPANVNNPLLTFATHLAAVYRLDSTQGNMRSAIATDIIKLRGFTRSSHFQLMVYKATPYLFDAAYRRYAAALARSTDDKFTPLAATMSLEDGTLSVARARFGQNADVPIYRSTKQRIVRLAESRAARILVESELENYRRETPLEKDYIELTSSYLASVGDFVTLVSVAAEILAREPNSHICFPMSALIAEVETKRLASLDAVIVAYAYARNVSSKKEYVLNEVFEDYLASEGVEKPSEILTSATTLDAKSRLFFTKICTSEVMDFLSCFSNSNELRIERIQILDRLRELGAMKAVDQTREILEIVGQTIVETSMSDLNANKVYVNSTAIAEHVKDDVQSLLSLYEIADEPKGDTFIRAPSIREEEKAVVAGDRNTTLLKILTLVRRKFLLDEKHGLDKNLSAEIRHGFFSNLMRSRLEKARLITEIDEKGSYKKNEFWAEKHVLFNKRTSAEIDAHLAWFSKSFNGLIAEAESWMQITTDKETSNGPIFDFSISVSDFEQVQTAANAAREPEKLIDAIMAFLWERTETCLYAMRSRLNSVFQPKVDDLFEQLSDRISRDRGGAAAVELTNTITQVRSDIKEDILTVTGWFKRNQNPYLRDHSLSSLVEISVRCFQLIKTIVRPISIDLPLDFSSPTIHGGGVKPFVVGMINLLDNCYRRSGFGPDTEVKIAGAVVKDRYVISISNSLTPDRQAALTCEYIDELKSRMASPDHLNLMRVEGGSGTSKAYHHFKIADTALDLNLCVEDRQFVAEVTYVN
ncbi:hypothetical protein R8871_03086 [Paraburkholderia graminis C4D1M]|uniref:Uncharacterized protein n=2 Tax=Paraburkholderia graminis TaxID=60548 RepID=B1FXQ1_PARG4|nr:hypothetical protein BgramDRAFT_1752 [Paraburkholderia graminis C4D1M]CAB3692070.1 hypothetical protein R8871_03086 [Paraburkholderia graminis C4D1M]